MKIKIEVDHQLDQTEALSRTRTVLESVLPQFQAQDIQIEETTDGANFSCRSLGFSVKGNVTATNSKVAVVVNLPLPAMMYKSRIENKVREGLENALL